MTPYDIIYNLVLKHGVADVLLMVKDVVSVVEEHIDRLGDTPLHAKAWRDTEKIIRRAVRDLPKVTGIK